MRPEFPEAQSATVGPFGLKAPGLNALKHGLRSDRVLAGEEAAYYEVLESLQEDYAASSGYQRALVRRLATLIVRLERAALVDARSFASVFASETRKQADEAGFSRLAFDAYASTVAQYELAIGRAVVKVAHELEKLGCSKGRRPSR